MYIILEYVVGDYWRISFQHLNNLSFSLSNCRLDMFSG